MKHKRNILIIIIDIFLGVALIYEFGSLGISLFVKMNFTIAFIAIIMMYKRLGIFSYLKYTIGQYLPMVLIPGIALLIFCVITLYYEPETKLTKSELISFYGSFLAFVGAFCLGYFIYKRNEKNRFDEKIAKCKLLLNVLETTDQEMLRVSRYHFKPAFINYDPNWINYYYEYEALVKRADIDLKHTLSLHFNTVDKMNVAMAAKDYELAGRIFEDYVWRENYSVKRYNSLEAKMCLISASHMYEYGYRKARMSWLDDPKVKKTVAEYSKAYYPIVETYIWNIMMKKNIRFMDNPDLDIEITDWLLKNDEFKKIAKFPDDKRIVCKIVHECFLMIERKSERLSYCWSEFTVK